MPRKKAGDRAADFFEPPSALNDSGNINSSNFYPVLKKTIINDDITWCENENRYKHCTPSCFLYPECHPKKVMNVDIPVDIDRESVDLRVDDSADSNFVPRNAVDRERIDQQQRACPRSACKLIYAEPASFGIPPKQRSILYDDISDAVKMGKYMADKKFTEGMPVGIWVNGIELLRWAGKTWNSIPARKPGRVRRSSRPDPGA